MNSKKIVNLAVVSAIYVVLTMPFASFGFGAIQFRLAEGLNHLGAFHKDYKWGVILGVFLTNLLFSTDLGVVDLIFGTFHTAVSFFIAEFLMRRIVDPKKRMAVITLVFSVMMFIIGLELYFVLDLPFWFNYFTLFLSELLILAVTAPVMLLLNQRVNFRKLLER
ncbi:QueT transporter family protein [Aerococcus kribbianus]|uniref:QueT transporter family protein n=1 Tax=Aerococcus kribbianus TaxID=2999064 RepID=A0A9X3JDU7_9LACT|nr:MULTISPECIES: QueT transporter family protein [unclassified Aerococcus]MCZ0717876.1 QueT transporter family protein [Aerococcus sp. YH-aer221]MCZ0726163.1 QueT transporter family protein [Aerococcus sp. YH-aer222]